MVKAWKSCMSMRINWILRYLPFESIDSRWISSENERDMMLLKNYYENKYK